MLRIILGSLFALIIAACSEERVVLPSEASRVEASYTIVSGTMTWEELTSEVVVENDYGQFAMESLHGDVDNDDTVVDHSITSYRTDLVLIEFGTELTADQADYALAELGYESATLEELLELRATHDIPEGYRILALGSTAEYPCPDFSLWVFPELIHRQGEWHLLLRPDTQIWHPGTLFLVHE